MHAARGESGFGQVRYGRGRIMQNAEALRFLPLHFGCLMWLRELFSVPASEIIAGAELIPSV